MAENIQPGPPERKGKEAYLEAGADYVISSIDELEELIRMINVRLEFLEIPKSYDQMNKLRSVE